MDEPNAVTSTRFYLADSSFLIGLAGLDYSFLKLLYDAFRNPKWQLYLGRKSYVPGQPIYLEDGLLRDTDLKDALIKYPLILEKQEKLEEEMDNLKDPPILKLPIVLEMPAGQGNQFRNDQPIGAAFINRTFQLREIRTDYVQIPNVLFRSE